MDGAPFDEHVRLLDRAGPPKERIDDEWGDITKDWCACQKRVMVAEFLPRFTGLVNVVDNVCPPCRPALCKMALLVCPRCRAVVARIPAHKDKSGFVFVAGRCYHLDCCAVCEPGIIGKLQEPTFILEMLHYFKQKGIAVPDQWKTRKYEKPLLIVPPGI